MTRSYRDDVVGCVRGGERRQGWGRKAIGEAPSVVQACKSRTGRPMTEAREVAPHNRVAEHRAAVVSLSTSLPLSQHQATSDEEVCVCVCVRARTKVGFFLRMCCNVLARGDGRITKHKTDPTTLSFLSLASIHRGSTNATGEEEHVPPPPGRRPAALRNPPPPPASSFAKNTAVHHRRSSSNLEPSSSSRPTRYKTTARHALPFGLSSSSP